MQSGFESLPRRDSKFGKKRHRTGADIANDNGTQAGTQVKICQDVSKVELLPVDFELPSSILYDSEKAKEEQWEYLDHTADVLVHAWGNSLSQAFGQIGLAFYAHLVSREHIRLDKECPPRRINATGNDLQELLFNFLDACLYSYGDDYFLGRVMYITDFHAPGIPEIDIIGTGSSEPVLYSGEMSISAVCYGEIFEASRHSDNQGTEIKAITYSAMQIHLRSQSFRAVDTILSSEHVSNEVSGDALVNQPHELNENDPDRPRGERKGAVDLYVIVDI